MANVMTAMVSGGKDAFEKSFTRSIPSNVRPHVARFDDLHQIVYQRQQAGGQFI